MAFGLTKRINIVYTAAVAVVPKEKSPEPLLSNTYSYLRVITRKAG